LCKVVNKTAAAAQLTNYILIHANSLTTAATRAQTKTSLGNVQIS